jgi:uncharacterized membrane protein YkvA (DUF1232 family)
MSQSTSSTNTPPIAGQLNGFDRLRLSWRPLRDERIATWMKALVPIIAAIYVLAPIDLIPDFILGLGQIDDLSVIGIAFFAMTRLLPKIAPREVVDEHLGDLRRGIRNPRTRGNVIDTTFQIVDEPRQGARSPGFDGVQETRT